MYPILFQYNNFQISTYGFMLMSAFIICNWLLKRYLSSININSKIGEDIIFYAAIGGILGAKIFYIIEYYPTDGYNNIQGLLNIFRGFFRFDLSLIISGIQDFGSGLVFLGGLIGGSASVTYYIFKNNLNWLQTSDWVAPYLILGQGIGRLGCFFVGCCYGKPTTNGSFFSFPHGRPPTTYEGFMYNHPDIFNSLVLPFYNPGEYINVYPTQLFEFTIYLISYFYLIYKRENKKYPGQIFFEYLFLAGISRFFIEFIRLNPSYVLGLTSAQIISVLMIFSSLIVIIVKNNNFTLWKK